MSQICRDDIFHLPDILHCKIMQLNVSRDNNVEQTLFQPKNGTMLSKNIYLLIMRDSEFALLFPSMDLHYLSQIRLVKLLSCVEKSLDIFEKMEKGRADFSEITNYLKETEELARSYRDFEEKLEGIMPKHQYFSERDYMQIYV